MVIGGGVDRKTAQRYIDAAEALGATREGATREGGPGQRNEELVAALQVIQPGRRVGAARPGRALEARNGYVQELIDKGLTRGQGGRAAGPPGESKNWTGPQSSHHRHRRRRLAR